MSIASDLWICLLASSRAEWQVKKERTTTLECSGATFSTMIGEQLTRTSILQPIATFNESCKTFTIIGQRSRRHCKLPNAYRRHHQAHEFSGRPSRITCFWRNENLLIGCSRITTCRRSPNGVFGGCVRQPVWHTEVYSQNRTVAPELPSAFAPAIDN